LVEKSNLADYWKTAPNTDEGKRLNVRHPEYDRFRAGLTALAPDFVVSYIRAIYKDDLYFHNPDAQRPCGAVPTPFAAGPFDALTVFCLDTSHEAMLCPELKKWHKHLNDVRYRAIHRLAGSGRGAQHGAGSESVRDKNIPDSPRTRNTEPKQ
jgi:hypothetical protein